MTTFLEEDGRCPQTPLIDPTRAHTLPRCSGRDGKGGRVARLWPGGPRATALRWASARTQVWPAPNRDDGSRRPVRSLFSLHCQATLAALEKDTRVARSAVAYSRRAAGTRTRFPKTAETAGSEAPTAAGCAPCATSRRRTRKAHIDQDPPMRSEPHLHEKSGAESRSIRCCFPAGVFLPSGAGRPTSIAGGTESGSIPLTLRSHEPMEFPQLGK